MKSYVEGLGGGSDDVEPKVDVIEPKSSWDTVIPWVLIALWVLGFTFIGFWRTVLVMTILYLGFGIWQLYNNPSTFYIMEAYASKWGTNKNDKWYARWIRWCSRPLYWVVDKAKDRWEKADN